MIIRLAKYEEIDKILDIYTHAKQIMRLNNNPTQWNSKYPDYDIIQEDIDKNECFVFEENGDIYGVFAFILGEDETYKKIYDGEWLNDLPYGTIHRIGSNGKVKNLLSEATKFCLTKTNNVRIDTHANNTIMQHLVLKLGYKYCGIIHIFNGEERLAYHLVK